MVKVECDGYKAPYQIDEKRIPPTGLKMRCPKCGTNLVVMKPGAEADLPAPAAAKPPAPRPGLPKAPPPPLPAAGPDDDMLDLPSAAKPAPRQRPGTVVGV